MASYNKVLFMGNLTRDPALRFLPNQTQVVDFGLAASRKFKTQAGEEREEVCFVECEAFGRTAEVLNQYLKKGKPVFIEGRLKFEQWEDKQGGGKRSKLKVHIDNFQFIGGRDDSEKSENSRNDSRQQSQRPQRQPAKEPDLTEPEFQDSDIPFTSALA